MTGTHEKALVVAAGGARRDLTGTTDRRPGLRLSTAAGVVVVAVLAVACASVGSADSAGRMLSADDLGLEWVVDDVNGLMFGIDCQLPHRAAERAGALEQSHVESDAGDRIMHIRAITDDAAGLFDQIVTLVDDCADSWRVDGDGSAGNRSLRWATTSGTTTVAELIEGDSAVHYFLRRGGYLPAALVDDLVS